MDKYDAINDHYCYPDSTVLRNRLNIRDSETLEEAEREITALTIQKITFGDENYSLGYLKELHRKLFKDLYDWAGELRDVDISKGRTPFCRGSYIKDESDKIFAKLQKSDLTEGLPFEEFCEELAEFYCDFNMLHPFRDGNGRVLRVFFEHLALSGGYTLNWKTLDKEEWLQANIEGAFDHTAMTEVFKRLVSKLVP